MVSVPLTLFSFVAMLIIWVLDSAALLLVVRLVASLLPVSRSHSRIEQLRELLDDGLEASAATIGWTDFSVSRRSVAMLLGCILVLRITTIGALRIYA